MNGQHPHPADQAGVMAIFNPAANHVYNAFDYGTARAREFFAVQPTEQERQRNVYLASDLTRFYACNYLAAWNFDATIDHVWLPNNGVAMRHDCLDLRCLKSRTGTIPRPGPSRVRRAFLNQAIQDNLWLLDPARTGVETSVNLVVTWGVDAQGNLVTLNVHSPAYVEQERVGVYWTEELMHPAETYEPEPDDEAETEQPEDLPGYEVDLPDEDTGALGQ